MRFSKTVLITGTAIFAVTTASSSMPVEAQSRTKAVAAPKAFTAKEKSEGAKYHNEILKEFGGPMQSPQTAYVVRVGKNIAMQSGLGNAQSDFNVTLLNSSVNNAFALPGGYVYITRQLVALTNSEAEMAGVLGHEVGHTAARHSEKRKSNATLAGLLGMGGSILGSVLGNSGGLLGALGGGLKEYAGPLAQVFSLKYSRSQEEEADDYGIRYLSGAGYDPSALSSMLNSLAMQTSVDTRVAGLTDGRVPEWASTHPDPARRVARASTRAKSYPASTFRNADAHLAAIDGMLYGDDPAQGVIEGQEFLHPELRMKFTAPNGFGIQNGTNAIAINGNSGKAIFTAAAFDGNRNTYIANALKAVSGENAAIPVGEIRRTTVNNIPAFYSSAVVNTQQGQRVVTVFAYEWAQGTAYHFVTIAASNSNPFDRMFSSMARLTNAEAAAVKPRKLRVVTVGPRDTIASLAGRMAYPTLQTERFLALNGLRSNTAVRSGQKLKIVTY
ncbi:M48 family metalloprotease [Sphingorhabdus sp.]|uniref:M48 family metalloprotease n=1 Tax=Sphingorhabdus sp. TaxID=1902408 RepID=UPI00391B2972